MIDTKKAVIQAVLSTFETGKPEGDYGAVNVLHDGAGISYGLHQATDGSDTLDLIVMRYIDKSGELADVILPYFSMLDADETTTADPDDLSAWVNELMNLLRRAGHEDPLMQQAQDEIFDEEYWDPCIRLCTSMQLVLPLSWLIVYDTCIHSGPVGVGRIRRMRGFPEVPPSRGGDERGWTAAYARTRYNWLSNYTHNDPKRQERVRRTKRRVGILREMISDENWQLNTPILIGAPYRVTIP